MTFLRPGVRVARGATYILIQGVVSTLMGVVFLLFLIKIPQTRLPPPARALKAIKKQDLELIHDYLPERFKRIAAWIDRLASIE